MSEDLKRLEEWAGALMAQVQPSQRRLLAARVGQDLRRAHAKLIAMQIGPDSAPYATRKNRKELRSKAGRIKRQKAAMFSKLRTNKFLKVEADASQVSVGFFGKVARIARVHQFGLTDKVAPRGPSFKYPARPLLGFNIADETLIRESLLRHMTNGS